MPRRTNPFQQLTASIVATIKGFDYFVQEEVLVKNKGTGCVRELDIVLQNKKLPTDKILIECRDHKRSQNVQWIDALEGKSRRLKFTKTIAVSSSGFTNSAINEAKERNITTLTLSEAEKYNWNNIFSNLKLLKVIVNKIPLLQIKITGNNGVRDICNKDIVNNEFLLASRKFNKSLPLNDYLKQTLSSTAFKDFINKNINSDKQTQCCYDKTFGDDWIFRDRKGNEEHLESIHLQVKGGQDTVDYPLKGFKLGDTKVLVGEAKIFGSPSRVVIDDNDKADVKFLFEQKLKK